MKTSFFLNYLKLLLYIISLKQYTLFLMGTGGPED